jgi:hypothetical protein
VFETARAANLDCPEAEPLMDPPHKHTPLVCLPITVGFIGDRMYYYIAGGIQAHSINSAAHI